MRQIGLVPAGNHANLTGAISNGKLVAYASNLSVYILDVETLRLMQILAGYAEPITSLDWDPHADNSLVVSSMDGSVCIWDVLSERVTPCPCATCRVIKKLHFTSPPILCQYNRVKQGEVAIVNEDNTVRLWNTLLDNAMLIREMSYSTPTVLRWATQDAVSEEKFGAHEGGVFDCAWDPLSDNYLLVSFGSGRMAMYDTVKMVLIRSFDKQAGGVRCVEWLPHSPGSFLAASERHGAIRRWNVSQSAPEQSFKVGSGGIRSVKGLSNPDEVLIACCDGSVGFYSLKRRTWARQGVVSHTQTVFTAEFKRNQADVLVTGCFDESIKIWDVTALRCVRTLWPTQGAIYSVAFPTALDDHRMAAVTNKGMLLVFDIGPKGKGKVLRVAALHDSLVQCVDWLPGADIVATASHDCTAALANPDTGEVLERFQHPAGVTGVSFALGTWGEGGRDRLLATACADMGVRVFALRGTGAGASYEGYAKLLDLRGHRGKTFSVRWSPLLHGRLASSSDDGTVRVWDLNAPNSHVTLSGHVDKTRVLAWHHEVPFLLLSGSWDACIRVWDIRGEGECVRVVGPPAPATR